MEVLRFILLACLGFYVLMWGLTEGEPHLLWEALWRDPDELPFTLEFDDVSVVLRKGEEIVEEFWWDNLTKVVVHTDYLSRIREDFFYILWGETEEQQMWIGLDEALKTGLCEYVQSLPEFDWDEYLEAQRSTVENQFIVWEREDSDA